MNALKINETQWKEITDIPAEWYWQNFVKYILIFWICCASYKKLPKDECYQRE